MKKEERSVLERIRRLIGPEAEAESESHELRSCRSTKPTTEEEEEVEAPEEETEREEEVEAPEEETEREEGAEAPEVEAESVEGVEASDEEAEASDEGDQEEVPEEESEEENEEEAESAEAVRVRELEAENERLTAEVSELRMAVEAARIEGERAGRNARIEELLETDPDDGLPSPGAGSAISTPADSIFSLAARAR